MVKPLPQTDYTDKICGSVTKKKYGATQKEIREKVTNLYPKK